MQSKIRVYVLAVFVVAVLSTAAIVALGPDAQHLAWKDAVLMALLALVAETFTVLLPRSAAGSMGFIPYFALAFVMPNWGAIASVAVVRTVLEIWKRREPFKAGFNISAIAITEAIAVSIYRTTGGVSFTAVDHPSNLIHLTAIAGGPAILACTLALVSNNLLVNTAIALNVRRPILQVWKENHRATIAIDLLAAPLIFIFAWVYAAFGVIMTATLWIPILGVRQMQMTNLELEKTNQELLELMVKSLEARDAYTSGHSRRVHRYSVLIARAMGLGDREIESVGKAALLHDVGKIHEKYAPVLAKTERLTPDEWALIQEHPADGANLVATMSHLKDVVPAIRHHHENWDGSGYPDGLAGELIPLASRIIRFADTIDAMTTERPYRAPLGEVQVRAEIVRCRGNQFDPAIADRLLSSPQWRALFPSSAEHTDGHLAIVGIHNGEHPKRMKVAHKA